MKASTKLYLRPWSLHLRKTRQLPLAAHRSSCHKSECERSYLTSYPRQLSQGFAAHRARNFRHAGLFSWNKRNYRSSKYSPVLLIFRLEAEHEFPFSLLILSSKTT